MEAINDHNYQEKKFAAGLKGINLDDEKGEDDPVERARVRAIAKQQGKSEEEVRYKQLDLGLGYEEEE